MIHLSPTAIQEVKRLQSRQDDHHRLFRLSLRSGGCSELTYHLEFVQSGSANDPIYEIDGLQVMIEAESFAQLQGLTLDYSEDLMGGNFRFHNPNALESCGCGSSFKLKAGS